MGNVRKEGGDQVCTKLIGGKHLRRSWDCSLNTTGSRGSWERVINFGKNAGGSHFDTKPLGE